MAKKTIIYDGSCAACSNLMLRIDHSGKNNAFNKVDFTNEKLPEGVSRENLEKEIHVIDDNGILHKNFDAILTIGEEYPNFKTLVALGRLPGFYQLGIIGYTIFAANRHLVYGKTATLLYTKITVALGFFFSILLTEKLWMAGRSFPLVPLFPFIPMQPAVLDYYLYAALLLLPLIITLMPNPRRVIVLFLLIVGVLFLWDINRLQSVYYQFFFMLATLGFFSWQYTDTKKGNVVLQTCQLIIVSIYFWGGLQKLNLDFVLFSFPWFIDTLIRVLPQSIIHFINLTGVFIPFYESGIGIFLLFKKTRNYAVIAAIGLHVTILFALGPFGHNYAFSIWPWNVAMIFLVYILFWKNGTAWKNIVWTKNFAFQKIILVLFGILPLLSFFNAWDSYLSFSMYAGNTNYASIVVSGDSAHALPRSLQKYAVHTSQNATTLLIPVWAYNELHVLEYPETRVFKTVGHDVCSMVPDNKNVTLTIQGKKTLFNADVPTSYSCAALQ